MLSALDADHILSSAIGSSSRPTPSATPTPHPPTAERSDCSATFCPESTEATSAFPAYQIVSTMECRCQARVMHLLAQACRPRCRILEFVPRTECPGRLPRHQAPPKDIWRAIPVHFPVKPFTDDNAYSHQTWCHYGHEVVRHCAARSRINVGTYRAVTRKGSGSSE